MFVRRGDYSQTLFKKDVHSDSNTLPSGAVTAHGSFEFDYHRYGYISERWPLEIISTQNEHKLTSRPILLEKLIILMKNHKIINKNIKIVNLEILKVKTWFGDKDL